MIWGSANEKILEPLLKLQSKILRIICFLPNGESNTIQAHRKTELLNLKQLYNFGIAKFMFKFKNGKLPKSYENFFKVRSGQQRYLLRNRTKEDYICEWGNTNYGMKRLQYEGVQL